MSIQRAAGNAAVASLMVQREFVDEGQTGEAPAGAGAGEVVQPELGEEGGGSGSVSVEGKNEFGEMDGAIDTGLEVHAFKNSGQTATSQWHHAGGSGGKGNENTGAADLTAPSYETAAPKKAGAPAKAWVKKGTGKVKVKRSYTGVPKGDNGVAHWAGSGGGQVYIAGSGVSRIAKHEAGHIAETKKIHDAKIKPLETRVGETKTGATEADAQAAMQAHVDWNTSVSAFATDDTNMNGPGNTFDTTDQAKADFYHDKGPKKVGKIDYQHFIEAP